jgi:formylglycine-generating enzyme required for sulfatase activity
VISVVEWGCSKHRPEGIDCKVCHGASQGHVADERNNVKPEAIPHQGAIAELCLSCHEEQRPEPGKTKACQDCHHVHALVDPKKPPVTKDEQLEQLEAKWQRYSRLAREGERHVKAQAWEAARAAFQEALSEQPQDGTARRRLRLCERRLRPGLAGFEIVGKDFDESTGLPREVRLVGLDIPMVLVAGGVFDMGSEQFANAKPAHQVRVEPFYLARHELTQNEWKALMGANPSAHRGKDFSAGGRVPVEQVSWDDAQALVRKLNERVAGGGLRLPTEAEWEFAARAGGESNEAFDLAAPRVVEQGQPNRLGLFDVAGNVREWCSSRMESFPYSAADGREGAGGPGLRVLRGGAYSEPPDWYDPAGRHSERPTRRLPGNGLRLARTIPEPQ